MTVLLAAERLIAWGVPVLPCWGVRPDGTCRCRPVRPRKPCPTPGKHPISTLAPRGVYGSTRDLDRVCEWFGEYPTMNLAARCGEQMADGRYFVVLDVDPRNDGDLSLAMMGELPETVRVLTPTGGQHLYFASAAPIAKGSLGDGLDLQGVGTYVIVPESRHACGGTYAWDAGAHPDDVKIADAPPQITSGRIRRPQAAPRPALGDAADTWLGVAFGLMGWLGEPLPGGKRKVRCPWYAEHSDDRGDGRDSGTVLLAPPRGYARIGAFSCRHGHCAERSLGDVLAMLPQTAWDAATKRYPVELDLIMRRVAA